MDGIDWGRARWPSIAFLYSILWPVALLLEVYMSLIFELNLIFLGTLHAIGNNG